MELRDIYEKLKAAKLTNEEFCRSEGALGLFLAEVSIDEELTEKFIELVPLEDVTTYVIACGEPVYKSLYRMQYYLNKWIKAFEKELNIDPQEEGYPEILELET